MADLIAWTVVGLALVFMFAAGAIAMVAERAHRQRAAVRRVERAHRAHLASLGITHNASCHPALATSAGELAAQRDREAARPRRERPHLRLVWSHQAINPDPAALSYAREFTRRARRSS